MSKPFDDTEPPKPERRHLDRRNDSDDAPGIRESTHQRLLNLERNMETVQGDIKEVRDNSRELLQMFTTVKSGVRIASWAAHFVKWLLIIAGGITALKLGLMRWIGAGT